MKQAAVKPEVVRPETGTFWRLEQWFADLDPRLSDLFWKFNLELVKFSKTLNLVSPKTLQVVDCVHFADCILAARLIFKDSKIDEIFDIGSGNGFPGVVIGIMYPECRVNLVEVDVRKSEFLKAVVATLGLKNVFVINKSVESLGDGTVGYAVSRGFAPLSKSILSTRRIFRRGGVYYHLKSEEWASEIASIPTQLCSFWLPGLVAEYKLPVGEVKYAVIKTEKISE